MAYRHCYNHPTVQSILHCEGCHKFLCGDCVIAGRYCSQECQDKCEQFYKRFKSQRARVFHDHGHLRHLTWRGGGLGMKIVRGLVAAVFMAAALYLVWKRLGPLWGL